MTKKLHYLFLISLLSTACMVNSSSTTEGEPTKSPVKSILLNEKGQKITPYTTNESMASIPPFWQDITNQPVLWVLASILNACLGLLAIIRSKLDLDRGSTKPYHARSSFAREGVKFLSVPFFCFAIVYTIASLLSAMWQPLSWDNSASPKKYPFTARFWRSFRFIFVYNLLPLFPIHCLILLDWFLFRIVNKITSGRLPIQGELAYAIFVVPFCILAHFLLCIAGLEYGYRKRHQQEDKKAINTKKVASLSQYS